MISDYDVYELSPALKRKVIGVGYVSIFLICFLFYHSVILAAVSGMLSIFLLAPYAKIRAAKRKQLLIAQFRDFLYSLSASVAAGRQMKDAIFEASSNLRLIYEEDSPLVMELSMMVRAIRENRESEETLLADFAERSHQEDIKNFVDVYRACRTTGGDMEDVIQNASEILMDKMAIEREIKALTAQKRFEGRIISVMPLAVIFMLNLLSPDYLENMYTTIAGRMIMTIALAGIVIAYKMMMKLTEIEV